MWEWLSDPVENTPERPVHRGMRRGRDEAENTPEEHPQLHFVRGGGWRSSKAELTSRPMLAEGLWRPDVGFRVWRERVAAGEGASQGDQRD